MLSELAKATEAAKPRRGWFGRVTPGDTARLQELADAALAEVLRHAVSPRIQGAATLHRVRQDRHALLAASEETAYLQRLDKDMAQLEADIASCAQRSALRFQTSINAALSPSALAGAMLLPAALSAQLAREAEALAERAAKLLPRLASTRLDSLAPGLPVETTMEAMAAARPAAAAGMDKLDATVDVLKTAAAASATLRAGLAPAIAAAAERTQTRAAALYPREDLLIEIVAGGVSSAAELARQLQQARRVLAEHAPLPGLKPTAAPAPVRTRQTAPRPR